MRTRSFRIWITALCVAAASCAGTVPHDTTTQYADNQTVRTPVNPAAMEWTRKSTASIEAGNWAHAIRTASAAIRIDPSADEAWLNRAKAYYEKGFYDEVIADCSKAIGINWKNPAAYNYRGLAFIQKGQPNRALNDLRIALEMDRENAFTLNNFALLNEKMNNTEAALSYYKSACELKNGTACDNYKRMTGFLPKRAPKMVKRMVDESFDAFEHGDWDAVIEKCTNVIKLDPANVTAYVNRAGAYANKKMLARAAEDCEKAIAMDPDYGLAYNNRGYIRESAGQLRQARLDYEIGCDLGVERACVNVKRLADK